jgi:hypothetical protein
MRSGRPTDHTLKVHLPGSGRPLTGEFVSTVDALGNPRSEGDFQLF